MMALLVILAFSTATYAQVDTSRRDVLSESVSRSPHLLTIEDWGCRPVGEGDAEENTRILNQLIDSVGRDVFGPILVPARQYPINGKLKIPKRGGIAILGLGGFAKHRPTNEYIRNLMGGAVSAFVWEGGDDEPMVEYDGYGLVWERVCLYGNGKAQCGLHIRENQGGLGSGKTVIEKTLIDGCKWGVLCGPWNIARSQNSKNADNVYADFLTCQGCDSGFRVHSRDSISIHIDKFRSYGCDVGLDFIRGGKLTVGSIDQAMPGILLRIGRSESTNGTYTIGQVTVDNKITEDANNRIVQVTGEGTPVPTITLNSVHFPSQRPRGPLFELKGASRLILTAGYHVWPGVVESTSKTLTWGGKRVTQAPYVSLAACRMVGEWEDAAAVFSDSSSGLRRASWVGCTNFHNEPYDPVSR